MKLLTREKTTSKPTTTQTSLVKYGTVIKACTCNSEYQDKRYGAGLRAHNLCKKGEKHVVLCVAKKTKEKYNE